jgi:tripartite-type tricarboxylate transporter receptor subunit TctC
MKRYTFLVISIISLLLVSLLGMECLAKDFPVKTIEIIVPFSVGGGTDVNTRAIAREVSEVLGVSVVVKNLPGADSLRGIGEVAHAKPDGYTLVAFNSPSSPISQQRFNPPFDLRDFTPIVRSAISPSVVIVKDDFPYNYKEMYEAYEKGEIENIAHVGAIQKAIAAFMKEKNNLQWKREIIYPGGANLVLALIQKEVPVAITSVGSAIGQIEDGTIKALAVLSDNRYPALPKVKSHVEWGFESLGMLGQVSRLIAGPPGMPEDIQKILENAFLKALKSESLKNWGEKVGIVFMPGNAQVAGKAIKDGFLEEKFINMIED